MSNVKVNAVICEICDGKLVLRDENNFECEGCSVNYPKKWVKAKAQGIAVISKNDEPVQAAGAIKKDEPAQAAGAIKKDEPAQAAGAIKKDKPVQATSTVNTEGLDETNKTIGEMIVFQIKRHKNGDIKLPKSVCSWFSGDVYVVPYGDVLRLMTKSEFDEAVEKLGNVPDGGLYLRMLYGDTNICKINEGKINISDSVWQYYFKNKSDFVLLVDGEKYKICEKSAAEEMYIEAQALANDDEMV